MSYRQSPFLSAVIPVLITLATMATATQVPVSNPSFELPYTQVNENGGLISGYVANGWTENSSWSNANIVYSRETNNPHSGVSCQKIVVQSITSGEVQLTQPFKLQGSSIYTASAWFRGAAGTRVIVRLQEDKPPYSTLADAYTVPLTADWQQITVTGYITKPVPAAIVFGTNAPGTIWVDDAALSSSAGTFSTSPNLGAIPASFFGVHVANYLQGATRNLDFEPPYVSAGQNKINGDVALNWIDNSDWADVTVTYSQDNNHPHSGSAAQMVNVQSVVSGAVQLVQPVVVIPKLNYTMTAWLRGQPGATVNVVIRNANSPYNSYGQAQVTLTSNWQQVTVKGKVQDNGQVYLMFQALQPVVFSVDDVTFAGPDGKPVSGGVPWPSEQFGTLRLWDAGTAWTNLEPLQGQWNWQPLDAWVSAAQANGVNDIVLTLGQTPEWASSDPGVVTYYGAGAPAPPKNIQDWRDYIQAVAQRYKGIIRYYEIWNEPNDPTYFIGTVPQLVDLTVEASKILKAVDPQNTVMSPAAYSEGYLDLLLGQGIAPYVDVIGFHLYETPPEQTGIGLANVRLVMAAHGVSSIPLWDTEGASGNTKTSPKKAPAYIVRKFLTDLAFGSGRFDWYTWGTATDFCVGTESKNHSTSAAGKAYGYLHAWLTGANLNQAAVDSANNWQIGLALANGDKGLIVWNPTKTSQFTLPKGFQLFEEDDIFGGTHAVTGQTVQVGEFPVLLRGH
jgi:hypothetical protein